MDIKVVMRLTSRLLVIATTLLMIACGGQGGGGSDGELIGTGFHGTSASGEAIAQAQIVIRDKSGKRVSTTSDAAGKFKSKRLKGKGPFLLRVAQAQGDYLYSIGHKSLAEEDELRVNLHPYTDLIVRNWFEIQNIDIDTAFEGDGDINALPTLADINDIKDEVASIIAQALISHNSPAGFDLISSPFDANHNGFDAFLDNSTVEINNSVINIQINNTENNIQNVLIQNLALTTDLTEQTNLAPSVPANVRALSASQTEAVVSWEASSDDVAVAHYRIYRNDNLIATSAYTSYVDAGLSTGTQYSYQVEAVDGRGLLSGKSDTTAAISLDTPDTLAPPAATDLMQVENNGMLAISWQQSAIDDVMGFKILRGTPGNVTQLLAQVTATTFTDFNVMPASQYCYHIVTFDAAGNESNASPESCLTTGGVVTESSISFVASNYQISESLALADIAVLRTGDLSGAVSVDYSVSGLTATAGVDFTETSGTLSWAAHDAALKKISIQIIQDSLNENDETVSIELSNPSANTTLGNKTHATLTIKDAPVVSCIELLETDITVDTSLSHPCYQVNENIVVRDAATLTILPGVTLKFAAGKELSVEVDGVLNAVGSADNMITFTGELPAPGYWRGIEIKSVVPSNIQYSVVEYGGKTSSFNPANIGLSFDGKARVEDSVIRYSESYGISLGERETLMAFSRNTLTQNESAPVHINANAVGVLGADSRYSGNTKEYIEIVGDIYDSQTWQNLDVDYRMPSVRTVVNGTLTIAPGATLIFPVKSMLEIAGGGTLKALGTAAEVITFTGLEKMPGYWTGIQFTNNSNMNEMDHTVVEYGGNTTTGNTDANVGVYGMDGRLSITNSTLRHSGQYGFEFYYGISLDMNNLTVSDNVSPGAIYFKDIGQLDGNSNFSGNDDDRMVAVYSSNAVITTDQVVKNIGIPYYAPYTNTMYVRSALSFEPGVEVQFSSGGGFNIESAGSFTAQGTAEAPIIFTGEQKYKGYWRGFQFTWSDSVANIIDHAVVEYAGGVGGNVDGLIGFFGHESLPTHGVVTNTVLRGSVSHGISKHSSTTGEFELGNTFEDIDDLDIHTYN